MSDDQHLEDRNDPGHDLGDVIGAWFLLLALTLGGGCLIAGVGTAASALGLEFGLLAAMVMTAAVMGGVTLIIRAIQRTADQARGGERPGARAFAAVADALGKRH